MLDAAVGQETVWVHNTSESTWAKMLGIKGKTHKQACTQGLGAAWLCFRNSQGETCHRKLKYASYPTTQSNKLGLLNK